jgi:hypothetical protein
MLEEALNLEAQTCSVAGRLRGPAVGGIGRVVGRLGAVSGLGCVVVVVVVVAVAVGAGVGILCSVGGEKG